MSFFDKEMKKICNRALCLKNRKFISGVCYGEIGKDLRAKIVFYEINSNCTSLSVKVINRTQGVVDGTCIDFSNIWGRKPVDNPNFSDGITPHISRDLNNIPDWCVYRPDEADYGKLAAALDDYLSVFADTDYKQGEPEVLLK